jgi:hypothetical protein
MHEARYFACFNVGLSCDCRSRFNILTVLCSLQNTPRHGLMDRCSLSLKLRQKTSVCVKVRNLKVPLPSMQRAVLAKHRIKSSRVIISPACYKARCRTLRCVIRDAAAGGRAGGIGAPPARMRRVHGSNGVPDTGARNDANPVSTTLRVLSVATRRAWRTEHKKALRASIDVSLRRQDHFYHPATHRHALHPFRHPRGRSRSRRRQPARRRREALLRLRLTRHGRRGSLLLPDLSVFPIGGRHDCQHGEFLRIVNSGRRG